MLRILRLSAGISLRELARAIDVSPTYLSFVENAKQPAPSAARIAQIEEALNVPPGCLLSITHGLNSNLALFVQQVPEVADFLSMARENSMSSADFMQLTGVLNTYGWDKMKQALEEKMWLSDDLPPCAREKMNDVPCIWPFLREEFIFDLTDIGDKISFFEEVSARIAAHIDGVGAERILEELLERERIASTGIGSGLAVPHAYVDGLNQMVVAFVRTPEGMDFDSVDGELVYMSVLLLGPRSAENLHLKLLARIARLLSYDNFCKSILVVSSPQEIMSTFRAAETRIP
jgi:PTS system nitrogen regulatory IIA component